MKLLYGVQATGQGHISRARAMANAFSAHDIEVDWFFSGRDRSGLFDMDPFGQYQHREGLSFASKDGSIDYLATLRKNKFTRFIKDVVQLDVENYDVIVTDFEPVTAWAGLIKRKKTIGIGHQYAFSKSTPRSRGNLLGRGVMNMFAPVHLSVGLHWYPYAKNVLPPILDLPVLDDLPEDFILVYLPFEDQKEVTSCLQFFPNINFKQYSPDINEMRLQNVQCYPSNISGFKRDLRSCRGVICNSGFELISECIQWQKPVLTKPLQKQIEQLSNALALSQLGYASVIKSLRKEDLARWLTNPKPVTNIVFPDVAKVLATWLADNCSYSISEMGASLWNSTRSSSADSQLFHTHPPSRNLTTR